MLAKWEVLGLLLGVLGGHFGFDLGSKIDVNTGTADFLESMLSPTWEHGFSMVSDGLGGCFFIDLGWKGPKVI